MATLRATFDDSAAQDGLRQLAQRLGNLQPVLADVGEYLLRQTDNRFRNEEAPDSTPWAPLAAATLQRKARRGKIQKILQEEGNLRTTLSYRASSRQVEIGSIQPYSTYLQFGTRKMVARPYLGISEEDGQEIEAIVQDWLANP